MTAGAPIGRSPRVARRAFAFDVFEGLVDRALRRALLLEALARRAGAQRTNRRVADDSEGRGGDPARSFHSSPGGPVQDGFYHAPWVAGFVSDVVGAPVAPTGGRGTFTYYDDAGDHLDVHRDVVGCDVAVISCLEDSGGDGGAMTCYPERVHEPLAAIRASRSSRAVELRLEPGQTIVLLGGVVPHRIRPTVASQVRIVSVLCYRLVATSGLLPRIMRSAERATTGARD